MSLFLFGDKDQFMAGQVITKTFSLGHKRHVIVGNELHKLLYITSHIAQLIRDDMISRNQLL